MPPAPLAAGAFGARNLPRLVLKSGYGPAAWRQLFLIGAKTKKIKLWSSNVPFLESSKGNNTVQMVFTVTSSNRKLKIARFYEFLFTLG